MKLHMLVQIVYVIAALITSLQQIISGNILVMSNLSPLMGCSLWQISLVISTIPSRNYS